ncbi:MAG: imidazole glycerol phosphate synthase subunit HisF, partial [Akkermansiaceae bacterium]|nr:imidazole glycerol phosphate synthase subunit HisF [Verrucomicrobiales bacterium]
SIFHFGEYTVGDVKQFLSQQGVPVRLPETVAVAAK